MLRKMTDEIEMLDVKELKEQSKSRSSENAG